MISRLLFEVEQMLSDDGDRQTYRVGGRPALLNNVVGCLACIHFPKNVAGYLTMITMIKEADMNHVSEPFGYVMRIRRMRMGLLYNMHVGLFANV